MITLLSSSKKQYKANLHSHSVLSDGHLTPEELKEAYKSHGYHVLAITDHEKAVDHSNLSDKDFLLITGYEIYIRPSSFPKWDPYQSEIHLNLFAKDPHNVGMIAYSPVISKYMTEEEKANVKTIGDPLLPREYSIEYVNRLVEEAKKCGYIAGYNHPYWSKEPYEMIMGYRGFFSMEMCNYSSYIGNRIEYNGPLYDILLRSGLHIAVNSSDDNHNKAPFDSPYSDSFGGFTYILADSLDYTSIMNALENQEFYSSMGPEIYEIVVNGNQVTIKTSPVDSISLCNGEKKGKTVYPENGQKITEATFDIDKRSMYLRFTARDGWKCADTRGFFPEEFMGEMNN